MDGLWLVFSLSFLTALSGALMPGPLFTYTIATTLGTERRGWLTGARVVAGHAVIESLIVCGLVLGVVQFLRAPLAAKIIGVAGGTLLLYMGIGLLLETVKSRAAAKAATGPEAGASGSAPAPRAGFLTRLSPPAAGALVSMSNPYWWVWWATIGSAFLVKFDISFASWPLLIAFFVGHELGDLSWYLAVSTALSLGRKSLPRRFVAGLLAACGVAIIAFGAWLGITPFL